MHQSNVREQYAHKKEIIIKRKLVLCEASPCSVATRRVGARRSHSPFTLRPAGRRQSELVLGGLTPGCCALWFSVRCGRRPSTSGRAQRPTHLLSHWPHALTTPHSLWVGERTQNQRWGYSLTY